MYEVKQNYEKLILDLRQRTVVEEGRKLNALENDSLVCEGHEDSSLLRPREDLMSCGPNERSREEDVDNAPNSRNNPLRRSCEDEDCDKNLWRVL